MEKRKRNVQVIDINGMLEVKLDTTRRMLVSVITEKLMFC